MTYQKKNVTAMPFHILYKFYFLNPLPFKAPSEHHEIVINRCVEGGRWEERAGSGLRLAEPSSPGEREGLFQQIIFLIRCH